MRSFNIFLHKATVTEPGKTLSLGPARYPDTMEQTSNKKAKRSNRGYTEVTVAKPLQYEHRMKVKDFLTVLQGRSIQSKPFEIFPGKKVSFFIKQSSYPMSSLRLTMKGNVDIAIAPEIHINTDNIMNSFIQSIWNS